MPPKKTMPSPARNRQPSPSKKSLKSAASSGPASKPKQSPLATMPAPPLSTAKSAPAGTKDQTTLYSRREMLFLLMRLEELKKKNEKMHSEQETKYGLTLDAVQDMQKEIDHAKAVNTSLLAELEVRKTRYERLEADMQQLKHKFETCKLELKQLRREQKLWQAAEERVALTENRCHKLIKNNKSLRALLLKNHVSPNLVFIADPLPHSILKVGDHKPRGGKFQVIGWK